MAKLRDISSIEHGLTEAIKNLKSKVIEEVTGKSESFLRKCSDPDLDQQLDHKDAVKIDKELIKDELFSVNRLLSSSSDGLVISVGKKKYFRILATE